MPDAAPQTAAPSDYGIAAARQAGYSDSEITSYLAKNSDLAIGAAQAAKYSDKEILDHLSVPPPPSGDSSVATPAPEGHYAAPVGGEFGDLSAQPWAQGAKPDTTSPAPIASALGRIGGAAADAYRDTPALQTPYAEDLINRSTGVTGQTLINPALHAASGGIAAFKGGMAALSQTAMELFGEKGGRDLLAFAASLPVPEIQQAGAMKAGMNPAPDVPVAEAPSRPQFVSERTAPDVSQLDTRNAIASLIEHDINENSPTPGAAPDRGASNQGALSRPTTVPAAVLDAPDIDGAIAAASDAAKAPGPYMPVTATQVAARDNVPIMEAWNRAKAENDAGRVPDTADVALPALDASPAHDLTVRTGLPVPTAETSVQIPKTSAEAKSVAAAYYQRAEQLGGDLSPDFVNRFVDKAEAVAPQTSAGQMIVGDSPITTLVDRIQGLRDQPISLQAAQEIDEGLGNLIDREFGVKGLSKEGKQLLDLQTTFRDMIMSATPEDAGGGAAGFDALKQARAAWSQAMKMSDLERIQERAALTDNPATSIRSGLRVLLSNASRVRGYSPEEITALKSAADRGVMGSLLHVFGSRLIPVGFAVHGGPLNPVSLAAAGAAHVGTSLLRNAATGLQSRRLNNAISVLGAGVPAPP